MRTPAEMEVVYVDEIRTEASGISSIIFSPEDGPRWRSLIPGQFVMVWLPGVDEVPMSVSYHYGDPLKMGITVQNIGEATDSLCSLKPGDTIGIRGPYGNGFSLPEEGMVIGVSGGVGGASTILPMEWAHTKGFETMNLIGSRNKGSMLFLDRFGRSSDRLKISTDDGSDGYHGFVTDLLDSVLKEMDEETRRKVTVFTCGPEMMMVNLKKVVDEYGVETQFSLERFMKCGIGLCDSCSMSGKRVCMDGPVFISSQIEDLKEFGKSHRSRSGKMVSLKERVG